MARLCSFVATATAFLVCTSTLWSSRAFLSISILPWSWSQSAKKLRKKLKWGCFNPLLTYFINSVKICYIFTYIKVALIVVSVKPSWGREYSIKNPVFWLHHEVMCYMLFRPNLLASVDVFGLIGQSAAQWATVWAEPSVSAAWL